MFLYSVTRGPSGTSTAAIVADYLASTVQAGDIIDLHDGIGRGTFYPSAPFAKDLAARREVEVQALSRALRRIADRGIRLTTATDLLARSAPGRLSGRGRPAAARQMRTMMPRRASSAQTAQIPATVAAG